MLIFQHYSYLHYLRTVHRSKHCRKMWLRRNLDTFWSTFANIDQALRNFGQILSLFRQGKERGRKKSDFVYHLSVDFDKLLTFHILSYISHIYFRRWKLTYFLDTFLLYFMVIHISLWDYILRLYYLEILFSWPALGFRIKNTRSNCSSFCKESSMTSHRRGCESRRNRCRRSHSLNLSFI